MKKIKKVNTCPRCGHVPTDFSRHGSGKRANQARFHIVCKECDFGTSLCKSLDEAIDEWNNETGGNVKEKHKKLTAWDWTTLVASWRYYEYRSTIASSMFPEEIIERFFSGEYSDESCMRIAIQFAKIDHVRNGEADWHDKLLLNCDIVPWTTFYAFCEAYYNGFTPIKITVNGKEKTFRGFYCRTTGHWHDADTYIKHPHHPVPYLNYEQIPVE